MNSIVKLNNFTTVILKFRSCLHSELFYAFALIIFVASNVINQNMFMKIIPTKTTYLGVNGFL